MMVEDFWKDSVSFLYYVLISVNSSKITPVLKDLTACNTVI